MVTASGVHIVMGTAMEKIEFSVLSVAVAATVTFRGNFFAEFVLF